MRSVRGSISRDRGGARRTGWIAAFVGLTVAVALAAPASAQAGAPARSAQVKVASSATTSTGPKKSIPGPTHHPADGKKTAKALCDSEVPRGSARCFAMVVETNGVVPHTASPKGLSPADIQAAYGLPAGGGAGMVIGIVDA